MFFSGTVNTGRYLISKILKLWCCPLSTFFALVTMERANISYSYKNIPIPDRHQYKLVLLRRIESFIKNMRWKAYFFLNTINYIEKEGREKYGFKTTKHPLPYQRDGKI